MKKLSLIAMIIAFISATAITSGCSNSELQQCQAKADKLWDNSKNPSHKNKVFWDAVARCKEKYG